MTYQKARLLLVNAWCFLFCCNIGHCNHVEVNFVFVNIKNINAVHFRYGIKTILVNGNKNAMPAAN